MTSPAGRSLCAALVAVIVLSLAPVNAKPIMPRNRKVTGQTLSLANLENIKLTIRIPGPMLERGIAVDKVRRRCERKLAPAKIQITSEDDVPELIARTFFADEPAVPDAFAFCVRVSVTQEVVVTRLKKTLKLDTFYTQMLGVDKNEKMKALIETSIEEMLDRFDFAVKVATTNAAEPEAARP